MDPVFILIYSVKEEMLSTPKLICFFFVSCCADFLVSASEEAPRDRPANLPEKRVPANIAYSSGEVGGFRKLFLSGRKHAREGKNVHFANG